MVNRAQSVEFVDAGRKLPIFNVGQPGMRNVVFRVALGLGYLQA
jgi:hypothetical protein